MMTPTVTAILPVFNGRTFLREAVQSVMNQTLPPVELIVIDDGSTDGSREVVEAITDAPFPIRVLQQANRGQSAARNLAASQAQGEYLAFLDQDDRWYPRHLELLVAPLVLLAPLTIIDMGLFLVVVVPIGFATLRPAMSGADPCTGSNSPGPSPMLAEGSRPMEPAITAASSDRMSPNRFSVSTTSNRDGEVTSAIAHASTYMCCSVTSA